MNGAAAHLIRQGEEITVMGFELCETPISPKVILLGPGNASLRSLAEKPGLRAGGDFAGRREKGRTRVSILVTGEAG